MKKDKFSRTNTPSGLAQSASQTPAGNGNLPNPEEKDWPELAHISVSIVIPAYNEEAAVGSQIRGIREVMQRHGLKHEIIVVDDGSEDATAANATAAGARVQRKPENRGYGAAIKTGILAAQYETIVIIDADGTYPPDQIPDLLSKLQTADMVVGARTGTEVRIPWGEPRVGTIDPRP
jgi:glycosyltransferase involved in cell wall biosynthesis